MKAVLTWLIEGLDPGVEVTNSHGVVVETANLFQTSLEEVLKRHGLSYDDVVDARW